MNSLYSLDIFISFVVRYVSDPWQDYLLRLYTHLDHLAQCSCLFLHAHAFNMNTGASSAVAKLH